MAYASLTVNSNSPIINRQGYLLADFWDVDTTAEATFIGRLEQGRRELAARLKRDVSIADIAEQAGMSGAAISNHKKKGTLPTRENMRQLASVFQRAGLARYDHRYLEEGDVDAEPIIPMGPRGKPLPSVRKKTVANPRRRRA